MSTKATPAPQAPAAGVVVDDRLGPGELKLGTVDYGVQISNVTLTPDVSSDDGTPTLGVPKPAPLTTIKWSLKGSAIQDFSDPTGFVNYCMDNALAEVTFDWTPITGAGGVHYTGTCQIVPLEVGGDVAVQITTDFEFAVVGEPVRGTLP